MNEWRICAGYPGYEISASGSIRRLGNHARWGRGRMKLPFLIHGHLAVKMPKNKTEFVHRLVARTFLGEPPVPGLDVAHFDGSRTNNHFSNLRWATRAENMADAIRHGTIPWGERNGHARLTKSEVLEIRRRAGSETQRSLAQRFGVSPSHISGILSGRFWRYMSLGTERAC